MKPFQRSSLEIQLDDVLDAGAPLPHLFSGHTSAGQRYLIIQTSGDEHSGTWMCAPITDRALHHVLIGSAQLRDAVAHTATGAIDIITVTSDGHCLESSRLCRELADEELPPLGARVPHDGPSALAAGQHSYLGRDRIGGPVDQSYFVPAALASAV
jgi:hypothetical protein